MKRSTASLLALTVALAIALGGCNQREKTTAGGEPTETIAPATPQPSPTGTDAMTQTVDVEGGRSDAEGGTLSTASTAGTTMTATTGTTATAAPAPPPTTTTR